MKRRIVNFICGIVVLVSVAFGVYDQLIWLPQREAGDTITPISYLDLFAIVPLMWLSIGILVASALILRGGTGQHWREVCLIVGLVLLGLYLTLLAVYFGSKGSVYAAWQIMMWLTKIPEFFLIPGLLISIGVCNKRVKPTAEQPPMQGEPWTEPPQDGFTPASPVEEHPDGIPPQESEPTE